MAPTQLPELGQLTGPELAELITLQADCVARHLAAWQGERASARQRQAQWHALNEARQVLAAVLAQVRRIGLPADVAAKVLTRHQIVHHQRITP